MGYQQNTPAASHSLHTAHSNNTKQLFLDTNEKLIILVIEDINKKARVFFKHMNKSPKGSSK